MILQKNKTSEPITTSTTTSQARPQQHNHPVQDQHQSEDDGGVEQTLPQHFLQKHGGVVCVDHEYALSQHQQVHHHLEFDDQIEENHAPVKHQRVNEASSKLRLFDGSRTDAQTFCAEFVSIAQTFELSDRACNELLHLVKRMAPPNSDNRCPDGIEDALLCADRERSHVQIPVTAVPSCSSFAVVPAPPTLSPTAATNAHGTRGSSQFGKKMRGRPAHAIAFAKYSAMAEPYGRPTVHQQNELAMPESGADGTEVFIKCHEEEVDLEKHHRPFGRQLGWDENTIGAMEDNFAQPYGGDIMSTVLDSLEKLSKDVSKMRRECALSRREPIAVEDGEGVEDDGMALAHSEAAAHAGGHSPSLGKRRRMRQSKQDIERCRPKYFVKVLDEHDQVVPICELSRNEMLGTVRVSREDPLTRILYLGEEDITERVLCKLDIALYLHNPSYCGRAAADALFTPEFLCRFHILSEGKTVSRSNRDALAPDLSKVFYDTLRKLGASRIIAEDRHGWMEQARDAVNQRNRDIKIPGCRRKFFQNSDPVFE
uniref:Actin-binding, cofilin/tropomyosin type n=1 Tax=Globodera pallida TaxID=36090 RepID=A0A183CIZ9_GLOPA